MGGVKKGRHSFGERINTGCFHDGTIQAQEKKGIIEYITGLDQKKPIQGYMQLFTLKTKLCTLFA